MYECSKLNILRAAANKSLLLVPPQATYLTVNRGKPLVRTVNFEESIK